MAEVSKLPGIGKKSALRVILHLLKQEASETHLLSEALQTLRDEIKYCKECYNISDREVCEICSSHKRSETILCVVEDIRDVMAIENTDQFYGKYHVLGGIISPMDGVGPDDLNIESLIRRITALKTVEEVILALPATMEGDTTSFYLTKKLHPLKVKVSSIARGVPIGSELEYTDEITLGRSIMNRTLL